MEPSSLAGWLPYKLTIEQGQALCQWVYIGNKSFTEPFFDDTIHACRQLSQNMHARASVSSLDMLQEWSLLFQSIKPAAFIFHVSRCGSTLIAQLLSLIEDHRVLSEVPFFDELLRNPFTKTTPTFDTSSVFSASLQIYGQQVSQVYQKLFIKTDSWHLMFYPQLRKMYPSTPFIIIIRTPAEVIRSQHKRRGMQSIPGVIEPEIFGFTAEQLTYNLDLYMSHVLERYYDVILKYALPDKQSLVVNYQQGINEMMNQIFRFLQIDPSASYRQQIEERLLFHGKYPQFYYEQEEPATSSPAYLDKCIHQYNLIEQKRKSSLQVMENKGR